MSTLLANLPIQALPPALVHGTPCEKVSTRYAFFNTYPLVQAFMDQGFRIRTAKQQGRSLHARHEVRLYHPEFEIPGEGLLELIISNSHNRSSLLSISLGIFRFACSNGLTVGFDFFKAQLRHVGKSVVETVQDILGKVREVFPRIKDKVLAMKNTVLGAASMLDFANEAFALKYSNDELRTIEYSNNLTGVNYKTLWANGKAMAQDLLCQRRYADKGNDLWSTLNVVQENLVKGGIQGPKKQSRAIKSIVESNRINLGLYKWREIAWNNPKVTFYAYSKSVTLIKACILPKNLIVRFSLGGKQDHLLDKNDLVAAVVDDKKERRSGIDDLLAAKRNIKRLELTKR